MSEDSEYEHGREEARRATEEALATADQAIADAERLKAEALTGEMLHEGIRQLGVIYGGLIGIAAHGAALPHRDVAGHVGHDLHRLVLGSHPAAGGARDGQPAGGLPWPPDALRHVTVTQAIAQLAAFVGIVAGFWHITWVAGVGMLVAGLVAVLVHSAATTAWK